MRKTKSNARHAGTSSRPELKVDWCSHEAAQYACVHWHYSKAIPVGKLVKVGVWENGIFIGVVIYSHGANRYIGNPYGLTQNQAVELTRVALTKHHAPVSKILSLSLRFLKMSCPGLRLVISYADADQDHHGGIYQATNWLYTGLLQPKGRTAFIIHGKKTHPRTVATHGVVQSISEVRKHLDPNATEFFSKGKHKYLMPLDNDMKMQVEPLRKPYPKRVTSTDSGVPDFQSGGGGASPTVTLSKYEAG